MRSGRSNVAVAWSLHTVIRRCSSRKNGRKECCTEYQGAMGGIRCLEWLIRNRKTEPLDRGLTHLFCKYSIQAFDKKATNSFPKSIDFEPRNMYAIAPCTFTNLQQYNSSSHSVRRRRCPDVGVASASGEFWRHRFFLPILSSSATSA